jgi:release factor glutamine methyltransferase
LFPAAEVIGLDASPDALRIAQENARRRQVGIDWLERNILLDKLTRVYDVIVSNPPYIPLSEKEQLPINVKGHDPDLALFVPPEDPLLFYRTIIEMTHEHLHAQGLLFFEVHEDFGRQVVALMQKAGFTAFCQQDLNGKDRIVWGCKE